MSTFKEIRGFTIKKYTTNPTNPLEGQMWYNNTTGTLKVYLMGAGAWASGNASPVAKSKGGGAGTQTANVIFAGAAPGMSNITGEYDGTNWTTSGVYGASSYALAGFGIQTAAIGIGGMTGPGAVPTPFEYDGSTWTATPGTGTSAAALAGAGTTAAGVKMGGSTIPFANVTNSSEEWNGSSWTASPGNLNTARAYLSGFGTQTAALGAGGYKPAHATEVETYDGSTWTAAPALPASRLSGAGSGTQAAAFYYGGNTPLPPSSITSGTGQNFDGSSWTTSPASLGTGRRSLTGSPHGTSTAALAVAGTAAPGFVDNTEEFTGAALATQTVTSS